MDVLSAGGYGVKLDQRNLRTPLRQVFVVPSEALALAVAQEWEAQESFVQPPLMHLVSATLVALLSVCWATSHNVIVCLYSTIILL